MLKQCVNDLSSLEKNPVNAFWLPIVPKNKETSIERQSTIALLPSGSYVAMGMHAANNSHPITTHSSYEPILP